MFDFRLGQVFVLLGRTLPFLIFRMLIYFGITLAYVIGVGGGAGLGWLFGAPFGAKAEGVFWGALTGFGIVSGALYFLREYLLYLVKAGHIAVLVELIEGREIPGGRSQIGYAAEKVKERFFGASLLFGLDQLIKAILKAINRLLGTLASMIPIPALQNVVKVIMAIIEMSLSYLDEVILAQIYRSRSENPWATAREALVLYAQNYGRILKNAVFLTLIVWFLTILVFVLVLGPVALLLELLPGLAGFWTFVVALVVALSVKAAVIEPIAMTAMFQVFFRVTAGQTPNPEWVAKLERASEKFRELGQRAAAAAGLGGGRPAAAS
ncbi:MAG: hypothetical protein RML12_00210 [Xanthomonadales bacterium]|nr:hypothetical protein [Xanthomonadales bacterium]